MKFIYPAVFSKTEDGRFKGFFPDLDDCVVTGDTMNEAVDNANEAAYNWIMTELSDEDWFLPPVSEASDLTLKEGEVVRNICVNIRLYEGWDE